MKQIITKFGMDLIAYALNGGGIEFSQIIISNACGIDENGSLEYDEEPKELTASLLNNGNGQLTSESNSTYIVLPAKFDNSTLEQGFYNTAAIIMARKSGDEDFVSNPEEIYAVCIIDKADADYIPPNTRHLELELNYYIFIAGAENVSAVISDSFSYVTKEAFSSHTHKASDIGAAAAVHKHLASDISSGVLPIIRGGTGTNSLDDLRREIMHFGTYTGNGDSERIIPLGVTPKFVFVWCFSDDATGSFGIAAEDSLGMVINQSINGTGYTVPSSYSHHYTTVAIAENGFKVSYCSNSGHSRTNVNGNKYGYIYY